MTIGGKIQVINDLNEVGEPVCPTAAALDIPWVTINDESALPKLHSPETTLILFDRMLQKKGGTEVIGFLGALHCMASIALMSGSGQRAIESAEKPAVTASQSPAIFFSHSDRLDWRICCDKLLRIKPPLLQGRTRESTSTTGSFEAPSSATNLYFTISHRSKLRGEISSAWKPSPFGSIRSGA
jgi:hypothetical protein